MAKLNLSQAAKVTGKNRTTIWRHIKSGKLSSTRGVDGMPFVDTSELLRVYGEISLDATPKPEAVQHKATPEYSELLELIKSLKKEQHAMKEQLNALTNLLGHTPTAPLNNKKPEDDPLWPKEVKTMADILLRNEIKQKY